MDLIALATVAAIGVVLITAIAAVAMVWLTVSRAESTDIAAALRGIADVIRAVRGKR
ncbi:hypothetical protein [Nonomuraea africana]|uniref:Multidrug resistance efflux pump n=1 Tax=Nonomuraea africana TaxID=46171 RepID=A0ABR9KQT8_9ACTN|nr:hypothetical protein [Nonomuraea africana]MBE1563968.1 multidrug resistance efflux pump [Nonomuraea africana]